VQHPGPPAGSGTSGAAATRTVARQVQPTTRTVIFTVNETGGFRVPILNDA
jgi:hypothetical protein